jgi:hypothetical protein
MKGTPVWGLVVSSAPMLGRLGASTGGSGGCYG